MFSLIQNHSTYTAVYLTRERLVLPLCTRTAQLRRFRKLKAVKGPWSCQQPISHRLAESPAWWFDVYRTESHFLFLILSTSVYSVEWKASYICNNILDFFSTWDFLWSQNGNHFAAERLDFLAFNAQHAAMRKTIGKYLPPHWEIADYEAWKKYSFEDQSRRGVIM